ncbi:PadR family transcriptional regulator [Marihabitans asiaticum]|uniref:PadR family transcriptional regulator n=1 Tax=Marihabitans asiaticum TaxID=415218 RepID=A0A560WGE7_9MICO|nr:PadR family transcriptional regulator [Marihabitans asiaticum]
MVARRRQLLDFAVLGLLHESPMHGYELRRRLNAALGAFRALSFGTLYPCLKDLLANEWIVEDASAPAPAGRRPRITYAITDAGRREFDSRARLADPAAWDDDGFDVRVAFFSRTDRDVRLRILEGRRSRLEERLQTMREASLRSRERMDSWTAALQRHGEEATEREVRWLTELIDAEHRPPGPPPPTDGASQH